MLQQLSGFWSNKNDHFSFLVSADTEILVLVRCFGNAVSYMEETTTQIRESQIKHVSWFNIVTRTVREEAKEGESFLNIKKFWSNFSI